MAKDNIYGLDFNIAPKPTPKKDDGAPPTQPPPPQPKPRNNGIGPETEKPKVPPPKEIRFISADEWVAGDTGFSFNQKCKLKGNVEFLLQSATLRRKIEGDTVVQTEDGVIENLSAVATGYIDEQGNFELEATLYFGKHYHKLLSENPKAKCTYRIESIRHSTGVNTINSTPLEMPAEPMKLDVELSL